MKILAMLIFLIAATLQPLTQSGNEKISIVVAANMKPAMDSIVAVYKKQFPSTEIQITYGSSGKFYEQIQHGAPFDLFFSADINYPNKLHENQFGVSRVKTYAIGHLALWSKKRNPQTHKMNSLLQTDVKKISIANPATAPYGVKAIETMKHYKVYEQVKGKLVYGENITQAAQFAVFGAADYAIVALSDCLSPALKKERGNYWIIPQESHSSIEQGCIILKHGRNKEEAKRFFDFISSKQAQKILTSFGYSIPQNQ